MAKSHKNESDNKFRDFDDGPMSPEGRNWLAVHAHNRNSAGPMKDSRTPRKQTQNWRDYLNETEE